MSRAAQGSKILYLTVDGVLQPLGYSQVCRILLGLSRRGFRYHLLSLEGRADLEDSGRVAALREELRTHGIEWTPLPYDAGGSARAAAANLAKVARRASALLASGDIGLVHARAYHAALVALSLKPVHRVPYLFDARGRWIDERLLGGRWFTNRFVEGAARAVERTLYRSASAFVTLTRLHGDDIAAGDFGAYNGRPIQVITTCADFDSFTLAPRFDGTSSTTVPSEVLQRLAGKLVVAFVGSTNAFYRHTESFRLAGEILKRRDDAHLLIISAQRKEFADLAERARIPEERLTIATASHRSMPDWLRHVDWAIQLLNGGVAKRGSMPTKLAEFLATGVRPIHFGCNDEVAQWVRRTGSGIVLESLAPPDLSAAAEVVAQARADQQRLQRAREVAQPHFDLSSGLDRYESLLRQLGMHG